MADEELEVGAEEATEEGGEEQRPKLALNVEIKSVGACQRHVQVTIPADDIKRYFDETYSELRTEAAVPGFRPGRAPRKLVEARYKDEISNRVKGNLLMESMAQVTEEYDLAAISEPDLDVGAIQLPDDGPLVFEFDLEVRPEFDVPNWKGLTIERPVRDITEAEVERRLTEIRERYGRLVPCEGAAEAGDFIVTSLHFRDGETELSHSDHEVIRLRPVLSFRDGKIENFEQSMVGVKVGETRTIRVKISDDAANESLRGEDIEAVFEIKEIKRLEPAELDAAFLERADFETIDELKDAIRDDLKTRLEYHQQQAARQQITQVLLQAADWDLPPGMLKRQASRELGRAVLEMQRSGFSDREIRAHENELRQNSMVSTARALKEHFILERIAEEEKIEDLPEDYDEEVRLIARQSGESARRVRAQLEKKGLMDALRNQIIERKVLDMIREQATFKDVPMKTEDGDTEAIDQSAGGADESDIPEAQFGNEPPEQLPKQHERP